MAQATTIKGGQVAILFDPNETGDYQAPCGLSQRALTITKGTEDVQIPDCTDPDKVDWLGRDAVSLAMDGTGEGVMAEESVETWLDAVENPNSLKAKIIWTFPAKTITWTGRMHVTDFGITANNGRRATCSVSVKSDGQMVRVVS